ncbi:AfsA-related hotdog domain-containing protein [Photobacterium carnosum]|uniref:AfsA-related hotdog domain-containing protein n=1 Tax=Photobacterium carnosum TaxID=2023717 RepID=UPI001E5389A2|nr:AfsA-related hotdog domain-containing protein [Photobacterium carnosum]MCD9496619.1 hypothetical protein [Photobacterium carnosum]
MDNIHNFTHKCHDNEIFINDLSIKSNDNFNMSCIVPENHPHFDDESKTHKNINPMFIMECCRQAETYITHKLFNIEKSKVFIFNNLSFSINENYHLIKDVKIKTIDLDIHSSHQTNIGNKLKNNIYIFNVIVNKKVIAIVSFNVSYLNQICYKHIRGEINKTQVIINNYRINPEKVGYKSEINSILSQTNDLHCFKKALININKENISYYDHYQDHITGMNLIESYKQLCFLFLHERKKINLSKITITSINVNFYIYIEISQVSLVEIDSFHVKNNNIVMSLTANQNGLKKSQCEIKLTVE